MKADLREISLVTDTRFKPLYPDAEVLALRAVSTATRRPVRTSTSTEGNKMAPRHKSGLEATLSAAVTKEQLARVQSVADARGVPVSTLVRSAVERDLDTLAGPTGSPMRVGEWALELWRAMGRGQETAARDDERADQLRAMASVALADVPGVVPRPIGGELIPAFVDRDRNVVRISNGGRGPLPLPLKGQQFTRPRVTGGTQVNVQTNQFDEVASRKMTIAADGLDKSRLAGYVGVSERVIDWSDPTFVEAIYEDLAAAYGATTEQLACAAVAAAITTNTVTLSLTADSDAITLAVATALGTAYDAAKQQPDVLLCAADRYAYLLGLTGDDGRPAFPDAVSQRCRSFPRSASMTDSSRSRVHRSSVRSSWSKGRLRA